MTLKISKADLSAKSQKALSDDLAVWEEWCRHRRAATLPALPRWIAKFVQERADDGKSLSTIKRYLWAISCLHYHSGHLDPTKHRDVDRAMQDVKLVVAEQKSAEPLALEQKDAMIAAAPNSIFGLRGRALLAVGYATGRNRKQLVGLDVDNVVDLNGPATFVVFDLDEIYLAQDAAEHLRAWVAAAGIEDGALFRSIHRTGAVQGRFCAADVNRCFKRMAQDAGFSPAEVAAVTSRSPRAGLIRDMDAFGIGVRSISGHLGSKTLQPFARYADCAEGLGKGVGAFEFECKVNGRDIYSLPAARDDFESEIGEITSP